jgi:hypothetical protein
MFKAFPHFALFRGVKKMPISENNKSEDELEEEEDSAKESVRVKLFEAVNDGDVETVQNILAGNKDFDCNETDSENCSLLWYATVNGDLEMVKILHELATDLDCNQICGINSDTVLHVAIEQATPKLWEYFINVMHVDVNVPSSYGATPLISAITSNFKPESFAVDLVRMLIDNNADVNFVVEDTGQAPLHYALSEEERPKPFSYEIIRYLLDHGADATFEDYDCNCFELAIRHGHLKALKYMCWKFGDAYISNIDDVEFSDTATESEQKSILEFITSKQLRNVIVLLLANDSRKISRSVVPKNRFPNADMIRLVSRMLKGDTEN